MASHYFRDEIRQYLDSIEGEAERIAAELNIDPASVSGWKKRRSASRANWKRLLEVVKPDWRDRIRDAWLRDRTPEEVWNDLQGYRAATPGRPPSPSRGPIAQIETALAGDKRAMEVFVGSLARLADVIANDPSRLDFLEYLYDAISGRRARVVSPRAPLATPDPGQVA